MNFLSLFVLIPVLMLCGLFLAGNMKQIRWVCATGATLLLILSTVLTFMYLGERSADNTEAMLFTANSVWYAPLNIHYSVGVDGISVAMLLLSSVIVFTGIFTSWKMEVLPKEFFMWFCLLSIGVFGFFISTDLFTMFMFYEIALIPMYLLIGVWGTGKKRILCHETDPDVNGWLRLPIAWNFRHIFLLWSDHHEHSGNCPTTYSRKFATLVFPVDLYRLRRTGSSFPVPHLEP